MSTARARSRALLAAASLILALAGVARGEGAPEWARYHVAGLAPWVDLKAVEAPGYRIVLSTSDGVSLEARVEVDATPLTDDSPFPPRAEALPADARSLCAGVPFDPDADALARLLTRGSRTVLEAVERVIAFTSRRIRYELPDGKPETAASCRARKRGSCVGRSLLAADLLMRSGVPVRQVTGVLAAGGIDELTPDTRPAFSESLGGVRHRWIEAYVAGLGWVPSDPGGLANAVSARHVALAHAPRPDFGLTRADGSGETRWPGLAAIGPGLTVARPRGTSLTVRFASATEGGAVLLSSLARPKTVGRILTTRSSSVVFDRVPSGDYRVLWRRPDGRTEAASIRVDGPAAVDLGLPRGGAP